MVNLRGNPVLHFLDRYAGIPLVAVLGCLKSKRPLPAKIESIGLLRAVAIGDTVLLSGVVTDLRRAFPRASLVFFAGPSNVEVARMLPGIDQIVELPVSNFSACLRAVRSIPVDVMIDFGQWPRLEALITFCSRASFTMGFRTAGQCRHYAYDEVVEHSDEVHELENFRHLVAALGIETGSPPILEKPPRKSGTLENYVVFHLWPGGRRRQQKQWAGEKWLRLIEEFIGRGFSVVLTGAGYDRSGNEEILRGVQPSARRHVTNAAGLSLQQTVEILAASWLVVSIDTGIMHLAAALDVPLVGLHGPSSSKRWGPVSKNAVVVESPLSGCGYISLGWEKVSPPPRCMECVQYETVRDACVTVLENQAKLRQVEQSSYSVVAASPPIS
jgi:ADP-heptose:LPS heptosyltransferase